MNDAAAAIELEVSLFRVFQSPGDTVRITEEEIRPVDQDAIARFGLHFESPMRRGGESVSYRSHLVRIIAPRSVTVVGLDQKDGWANSPCLEEVSSAELTAIQAHRVATQPAGQRYLIEKLLVPETHLPVELPGRVVPVEIEGSTRIRVGKS